MKTCRELAEGITKLILDHPSCHDGDRIRLFSDCEWKDLGDIDLDGLREKIKQYLLREIKGSDPVSQ